ncbi:hypothetical protein LCGC14_0342420 [marine sediment metagenome]|uniref:Uncharacterized protein n=1 Tax=marine sediment metagenome TaxID=412755 RepID=A0A0F9TD78_9ZZZZ
MKPYLYLTEISYNCPKCGTVNQIECYDNLDLHIKTNYTNSIHETCNNCHAKIDVYFVLEQKEMIIKEKLKKG